MNSVKETIEYILKIFELWITIMPWESGLRIRLGKHIRVLSQGIYWRIPFIDSIYVQTTRLRIVPLSLQTLTTKDGKTVSIIASIGYSITDIKQLYNTLYHPDSTIFNIALGEISKFVSVNNLTDCKQETIENFVMKNLQKEDIGVKYEYFKINGFAVVRTYRLLQDGHWAPNDINMDLKR